VVISERVDSKAVKYLVPTVPFPYKSAEEYEATLENPIGREWNRVHTHEDQILPAVITRPGQIIEPITFKPGMAAALSTQQEKVAVEKRERAKLEKRAKFAAMKKQKKANAAKTN
jgi:hypothetical protein